MPADIIHIHSDLFPFLRNIYVVTSIHKTITIFGKYPCGVGAYVPKEQISSLNSKFITQFQHILNASLINQSRINKPIHKFSLFFHHSY